MEMNVSNLEWLKGSRQSPEWLAQVLAHDFTVFHLDGDKENNVSDNLVLVFRRDVGKLEEFVKPPVKIHKSKLCYELRNAGGLTWSDISKQADVSLPNAVTMAKRYAASHSLPWPIPSK